MRAPTTPPARCIATKAPSTAPMLRSSGSASAWASTSSARSTTLSAALADGAMPLLFMNGVGGLGAPYWLPDFQSEFLPVAGGAASSVNGATELQQIGAVVESIAFLIAVNVLAMHRAAPLQRLTVTGGLAACDYLCEVLAEATQMTVERPAAARSDRSRHRISRRGPAAGLAARADREVFRADGWASRARPVQPVARGDVGARGRGIALSGLRRARTTPGSAARPRSAQRRPRSSRNGRRDACA